MNIDDVLNEAIQLNKAQRRFLRPSIADLLYHPTQRHIKFPIYEIDNETFEITELDEAVIDSFDADMNSTFRYQFRPFSLNHYDEWDTKENRCIQCFASISFGTDWCKECHPTNPYTTVEFDYDNYAPLRSLNDLRFDDEGFPIPQRNNNISYTPLYSENTEMNFYEGVGRFK